MLDKATILERELLALAEEIQRKLQALRQKGVVRDGNDGHAETLLDRLALDIDEPPEPVGVVAEPRPSSRIGDVSAASAPPSSQNPSLSDAAASQKQYESARHAVAQDDVVELAAAAQARLLQVEIAHMTHRLATPAGVPSSSKDSFGQDTLKISSRRTDSRELGTGDERPGDRLGQARSSLNRLFGGRQAERTPSSAGARRDRLARGEQQTAGYEEWESEAPQSEWDESGLEENESEYYDEREAGHEDEYDGMGALDANLVAGIVRWVAGAKRRLGAKQMVELLEVYKLSGNLSPAIERIIVRVANMPLPDESHAHNLTAEDLVDLFMMLHGIIFSSGEPSHGSELPEGDGEVLDDIAFAQSYFEQDASAAEQSESLSEKSAGRPSALSWWEATVPELGVVAAEQDLKMAETSKRPSLTSPATAPGQPAQRQEPAREVREQPRFDPPKLSPSQFRAVRATSPEDALNTLIASLAGLPVARTQTPEPPVQKPAVAPKKEPAPIVDDAPLDYPSDLTEREWSAIESLLPAPKAGG
ncbi:MAG: hypothetical protein FJ317_07540, partial [SAR202 cluster bacterium]|nr:hypothetical protein [SAR202 cluster bacterium]